MSDNDDIADVATSSRLPRRRGQIIGPLTTAGLAILLLGIVTYIAGWQLGWVELLVVAAACLLAMAIAVPFVLGRSRLEITRTFEPERISAGESIHVDLLARNTGRGPSRRAVVEEHIGAETRTLSVPGIARGGEHHFGYDLASAARAKLQLGPAEITRTDPLGLLRRSAAQSTTDTCWIYPATRLLAPLHVGFAKDLEGPTSDASPAGDVAFHAIRPYQMGDDRRHIHWLSTAKTGELMVRHYVDNRRPHLAILLDIGREAYTPERFESAVSVAASLAASLLRQQLPVSIRIGNDTVLGTHHAGDRDTVLEALTECTVGDFDATDLVVSVAEFIRTEPHASAIAIVTGTRPAEDLLGPVVHARRRAKTLVLPIGEPGETVTVLPGARCLPAADLEQFVGAWSVLVS